jgi:hypothetical protein
MPLAKQCPQLITIVLVLLIVLTLTLVLVLEGTHESTSETDKLNGTTSASTLSGPSIVEEIFSCDIFSVDIQGGRCGGGVDTKTGLMGVSVAGGEGRTTAVETSGTGSAVATLSVGEDGV